MPLDTYVSQFVHLFNYSLTCMSLPIAVDDCAKFWIACYLAAIFVLALVLFVALRNILHNRAAFKAYEKRMIERAKIADPETMKKEQWQFNQEYDDIDQSDLAEKMRQQINKDKVINK